MRFAFIGGGAIGHTLDVGAPRVGAHETSTIETIEAQQALVIHFTTGAVVEPKDRLAIPVRATRHVHARAKLLEEFSQREVVARA